MEGREAFQPARREEQKWDLEKFKLAVAASGGAIVEAGNPSNQARLETDKYSEYPPQLLKAMQFTALFANEYLTGPVIQTPEAITDAWKRRDWRKDLIADFGDQAEGLLNTNRLRANRIIALASAAARIVEKIDEAKLTSSDAQAVREAALAIIAPCEPFADFTNRYREMTLAEQMVIVQAITTAAQNYIDLVTTPELEERRAA